MQKPLSNLSKPNLNEPAAEKILLLTDDLSNKGGIERVVTNIANALCELKTGGGE